jgi:excisionase family DNA binding protein
MRDPNSVASPVTAPILEASLLAAIRQVVAEAVAARPVEAPASPPLLTKSDMARYLHVSVRTIDTLVAEGELVPIHIRSARRFTKDAVDRYIRRQAGR